ncbi:MAG TPA: 2-dehydropantoate 2-reductase [Bacillota bacterium]|jgi:2-dehydropantoate 2-reductase|nr:2-dehydropantoate 2-reductase [Bacillota bacterium]HOL08568.1 2-dehydropantoate 2-reductase [Bacillota bacterium]HPO97818.1 2-dehydropantoate 2-reductase [Bacillota bacterium]
MDGINHIRRICIYGVGGVGGYFGGIIAHQLDQRNDLNQEIYFIARGPHLEKIQKDGLTLKTNKLGTINCNPSAATNNIEELPALDLILLCVKGYDLEETIAQISKHVAANTVILPLLNGMDIYERIRKVLNVGVVLPGCTYVSAAIEAPGFVAQTGEKALIVFGKDPQYPDFKPEPVLEFFNQMQIDYQWLEDPLPAIWEKYLFIAAFALVTGYSGKTIGAVLADPSLKEVTKQIMEEIRQLAAVKGVKLKDSVVADTLDFASRVPFETKTSFQRDLESGKGKNEGSILGAAIIEMGREYGVSTPTTEKVYQGIFAKPY